MRTRSEGFTLLEVIIALAIMTMAFSSILLLQIASVNATTRAKTMNVVGMLSKKRMTVLEHEFEGKTFEEFKKEESGAFDAPYQDYRWKFEVKEIEFPALAAPQSGEGGDSGSSQVVEMVTKLVTKFLSKSVREVRLYVYWMSGTKQSEFLVSTYWVNLNNEFSLSP